jgi:hypothetical protein
MTEKDFIRRTADEYSKAIHFSHVMDPLAINRVASDILDMLDGKE